MATRRGVRQAMNHNGLTCSGQPVNLTEVVGQSTR